MGKKKGAKKTVVAEPTDPAERLKAQGNAAFAAGDWAAAVDLYSQAVALAPDNKALFSNRSNAYLEMGTPEGDAAALADAETCTTLAPEWPKSWYRLGNALARFADRLPESREALQRGLDMQPDNAELQQALVEVVGRLDDPAPPKAGEVAPGTDKFQELILWLKREGGAFPKLYMREYSPNNRGCHALVNMPDDEQIMAIPKKCLITVEMGKATEIGMKMQQHNLDLTAKKHCYLSVFCLVDMLDESSFFQPYYRILPVPEGGYANMPIFWTEEELGWLEGSYLLTQISDRKKNIRLDYDEILRVAPEFAEIASLEKFSWARMMTASRNFGINIDGVKTDALVPYADMLNHKRPRETRWTYDQAQGAFTIHTVMDLSMGAQIYDSYGKKCNSRFLLNYGFSVEDNRDPDGKCHNEARLYFELNENAPAYETKVNLLAGVRPGRGIRCSMTHSDKNTQEALSYLRFYFAEGNEVIMLPSFEGDFDLQDSPIGYISIENEKQVLRAMCDVATVELGMYPTLLEEDNARLESGELEMYSNERNALVHVRGEKEVLRYWANLVDEVLPLFDMRWADLKKVINKTYHGLRDVDKYVREVVKPLVQRSL